MSLNQINLNAQHLTGLYGHVLVETGTAASPPAMAPVKYLGNNQKHILIFVHNPEVPFLADEELNFLTSILAACKLGLADVAILNLAGFNPSFSETYISELAGRQVLLFGIEPLALDLPISFPPFQLQAFRNAVYLCSPSLGELARDKALKMQLWNCLKQLFKL